MESVCRIYPGKTLTNGTVEDLEYEKPEEAWESYLLLKGSEYALPTNIKFGLLLIEEYLHVDGAYVLEVDTDVFIKVGSECLNQWKSESYAEIMVSGHRLIASYREKEEVVQLEFDLNKEEELKSVMRGIRMCISQVMEKMADRNLEDKILAFDHMKMTTKNERLTKPSALMSGFVKETEVLPFNDRAKVLLTLTGEKSGGIKMGEGHLRWFESDIREWRQEMKIKIHLIENTIHISYVGGTMEIETSVDYLIGALKYEVGCDMPEMVDLMEKMGIKFIRRKKGEMLQYCGLLSTIVLLKTGNLLLSSMVAMYEENFSLDYEIEKPTREVKKALKHMKQKSGNRNIKFTQKEYDKPLHKNKQWLTMSVLLNDMKYLKSC